MLLVANANVTRRDTVSPCRSGVYVDINPASTANSTRFQPHVNFWEFFLFFPPSHVPCNYPFNDVYVLQYSAEGCISPWLVGMLRFFLFGQDDLTGRGVYFYQITPAILGSRNSSLLEKLTMLISPSLFLFISFSTFSR